MINEKSVMLKKRSLYSRFEKRDFPFVYLIVAFPVIQAAVFWFYVSISMVTLAFQDLDGNFSLEMFKYILSTFNGIDAWGFNLWQTMGRSLMIFAMTNVVFVIGIPLAYIMTKKMFGSRFFRLMYALPGMVGAVIFTAIMKNIYSYDGFLIQIVKKFGIELPAMIEREGFLGAAPYAFITLMLQNFIFSLTGGNLILAAAYKRIPDEIFDAAKIDGVGFWREIWSIGIPCAWSTISTLFIFGLCSVFTSDINIYLYTSGTGQPELSTINFYLYSIQVRIAQRGSNQYSYVSAFGLLITAFTIPVVLLGQFLLSKRESIEL